MAGHWHWRNSAKTTRFMMFDARAAIGVILVLVRLRPWTIMTAIVIMFFFWILERLGLTFPVALRTFRTWINGPKRPAILQMDKREYRDRGY